MVSERIETQQRRFFRLVLIVLFAGALVEACGIFRPTDWSVFIERSWFMIGGVVLAMVSEPSDGQ